MDTLTITFSGICTHFHNWAPSDKLGFPTIPMRSVLPNATGVHFGLLQRSPTSVPPTAAYYLMPHGALVSDVAMGGVRHLLNGATIEVLNVDKTQPPFAFDWSFGDGYHLGNYVPSVVPSPDVVLNYNAACYFDFYYGSGRVWGDKNDPNKMLTTQVTVPTIGPPQIQITPFPGCPLGVDTNPLLITSDTLYVANQDFEFDKNLEDKPFDFVLNYLVTQAGLPQFLTQNTPGMIDPLPELTKDVLGLNMIELGVAIQKLSSPSASSNQGKPSPAALLESFWTNKLAMDLDQSCSDSHFP